MKIGKIILASVLWLVVIGLGFYLYNVIMEPVNYKEAYERNKKATTERMEDIRIAQDAYIEAKGIYANNWDTLISAIKNDLYQDIIINGDPDDTTIVTTYDTVMVPINSLVNLKNTSSIDSLRYIPFSNNEIFDLEADVLKEGRTEIPVYRVIATRKQYLKGLSEEFASLEDDLVMGSLTKASDAGNWE